MIKHGILLVLMVGLCGVANAAEPKDRAAYIGGSVGSTDFDTRHGVVLDNEPAFQIYAGYKMFRYFAMEGRYSSLSRFSDDVNTLDIKALSVYGVGILPFGRSGWELFMQLGVAQVKQDFSGIIERDDIATAYGFGLRWHISQHFAVAAEVDGYRWDHDPEGVALNPSLATGQLGIQYSF